MWGTNGQPLVPKRGNSMVPFSNQNFLVDQVESEVQLDWLHCLALSYSVSLTPPCLHLSTFINHLHKNPQLWLWFCETSPKTEVSKGRSYTHRKQSRVFELGIHKDPRWFPWPKSLISYLKLLQSHLLAFHIAITLTLHKCFVSSSTVPVCLGLRVFLGCKDFRW